ncbi:major facilitator superfamily MFS_1 [Salinispora tropica CNB-440]|uniref:Major facilitator superfamily MFS_1 n=1 Tax=Salinispora tropica (strain ATCC BAA-916 / DSM 44818 / JCM 13857 / NBRC 105044 / CNB-440) TaxID=369723 RepID=A4X508_SALTO|nr:major facilitator superfamily MFS_1 [Salinispora tropica CNB-440]
MDAQEPQRAGRREWWGLAALALPTLLVAMDLTVLHLAVPALSEAFKPSSSELLWITDIYGFLIAGFLITMGSLGDRIGRRRLLLIGAFGFGVASLLAAFSTTPEMLILTRALLGVAGATLMPSTLALIRSMFQSPAQRPMAIGVWMTSFVTGTAIGPLVGGVLLGSYWWGSVFLLGVPVMVLLLIIGPMLLPEEADPDAGRPDLHSALLSLVTILAVVFGFKQFAGGSSGPLPWTCVALGAGLGWIFVRRQRLLRDPLLDLALFTRRTFGVAVATQTLTVFAMAGVQFFAGQYLQLVLGMSPLRAGLWSLPWTLMGVAGAMLAPFVVRRLSRSTVMAGGLALGAAGFGALAGIDSTTGLTLLVVSMVIASLGISGTMTLSTDLAVGAAPEERAGSASAISETGSELGLALGIAVLGSVGSVVYRQELARSAPVSTLPESMEVATDTLGGAVSVANELPGEARDALLASAREAFTTGMAVTSAISSAVLIALAIAVGILLRTVVHRRVRPPGRRRMTAANQPGRPGPADRAPASGRRRRFQQRANVPYPDVQFTLAGADQLFDGQPQRLRMVLVHR